MIALEKERDWKSPHTLTLEATIAIELRPGLPAAEVDRRVAQASRAGDIGARALAFYLVDLSARGAHQELGFHSVVQYAHMRYGIQPSTAREYLAVGRALEHLPAIDEALCSGRLSWSKARLLVRIATAQTEVAWIEWSARRSVRDLATQARHRRAGELPTDPARRRIHEPAFAVQARLSLLQWQVWSNARQKLSAAAGRALTDVELLVAAAEAILRSSPAGSGSQPLNDSHFKVVIHHDEKTGRTSMDTVDGLVELDPRTAGDVLREAGHEDLARRVDPYRGDEVAPELRDAPTTPEMLAMILARDGLRCRCCGETKNLTGHHIIWRRYGGRTEPKNLATLCDGCHSLVHARLLVIEGSAEGVLRFTDAQGRALAEGGEVSGVELRRLQAVATVPVADDARASSPAPELPVEVGAGWLARNGEALVWNDRHGTVEYRPDDARASRGVDAPADERDDARASRPRGLDEVIGQRQAVRNLRRAADAARRLGEPLPHILLAGPQGLGKTSLARAVAAEVGRGFHAAAAPAIVEPGTLLRMLGTLAEGDVLFLDEIHRLPARLAELLYEAMEDWSLSVPVRWGNTQRTLHVRLPRFALIGATSQEEMLPNPLRGRFVVRERLEFYPLRDVARILERGASRMKIGLDRAAALRVAAVSRGTPREALALLRSVRDEAVNAGCSSIDAALAARTLRSMGIDELGLVASERRYLDVLRREGGPLGLTTLAARLAEERDTIQRVYEPYLLRLGLVRMTPWGRALATPPGR